MTTHKWSCECGLLKITIPEPSRDLNISTGCQYCRSTLRTDKGPTTLDG